MGERGGLLWGGPPPFLFFNNNNNRTYMYRFPDIPDGELKAMMDIEHMVPLLQRSSFHCLITDRMAMMWASLNNMREWINEELQTLDPYLRFRWEFSTGCYVCERIDTGLRAYIPLLFWRDDKGIPRNFGPFDIHELMLTLRKGDMRRFASPEKYLEYKRAEAAKIRKSLENKHNDMVYGAVDSLTNHQVSDMITAERAIAVGEKIRPTGKDADFLNKVWDRQKQGLVADIPDASSALNPGMAPGKYRRIN